MKPFLPLAALLLFAWAALCAAPTHAQVYETPALIVLKNGREIRASSLSLQAGRLKYTANGVSSNVDVNDVQGFILEPPPVKTDERSEFEKREAELTAQLDAKTAELNKALEQIRVLSASQATTTDQVKDLAARAATLEISLTELQAKYAKQVEVARDARKQAEDDIKKSREQVTLMEQRVKEKMSKVSLTGQAEFLQTVRSVFRVDESGLLPEPVIELSLYNNTTKPVSKASFRARLFRPGRTIPDLEDEFYHVFQGGLERGERINLSLRPGAIWSKWASIQWKPGMQLQIEAVTVEGPDGLAF